MEGDLRDLVEMVVARAGLIEALEAESTDEAAGAPRTSASSSASSSEFAEDHDDADLPAFMEWLALRTDLDTLAEGDEYVTLMTVHTAKGLEYPVVFVAGLEESIFPHANSMFEPVGLEEERRLAYVAITRARERLYLTHAHARSHLRRDAAQPAEPLHRRDPRRARRGVGRRVARRRAAAAGRSAATGAAPSGTAAGAGAAGCCGGGARVFGSGGAPKPRVPRAQAACRDASRWATWSTTRRSGAGA